MIIMLSSPDNCGKTTQIEKLRTYLFPKVYPVWKYSALKGVTSEEHEDYMFRTYRDSYEQFIAKDNILCDRFSIEEYIYSPIYRNYFPERLAELESMHALNSELQRKIYQITFIDTPENLLKREDGLSLSQNQIKLIEKEVEDFKTFHEDCLWQNKILIDINRKDIDTVFKEIVNFLEKK